MDYSQLVPSPLFKGLTDLEIDLLLIGIDVKVRKFGAGSLIAQSGDTVTSLLIVTSGVAKGEMVDFSGRVIKIEEVPAPGALAAAFMFGNKNYFPVNVMAVTDLELMIIEKPSFLRLLMKDDRLLINFLDMISNRSQFLSEKIKFLNFKTIKIKLAQFFLQRLRNDSLSFRIEMTQNELAEYFGVARPSLARAIGDMEEEGLIEASGKIIRVLDKKRLTEMTRG